MCSIFYFQFSSRINADTAYMINWDCKHEEFPIGKECSRKWVVYDPIRKEWFIDPTVTLVCTE